jgi:hypothetical protein
MLDVFVRTDPSIIAEWTIPEWKLRDVMIAYVAAVGLVASCCDV